ncbi:MAG: PAS-domain containing protein [Halocynthiibacter sp.]
MKRVSDGQGGANYAEPLQDDKSAERAYQDFLQVLTKTFAYLAIGLAIFNNKRELVLFNPALSDMTRLPPEYLTRRPQLIDFFDQLRDNRIMPEPKDYDMWRRQMVDMETSIVDGSYQETWDIAGGCMYRVTGRPHPDGAVAFLFEDISKEVGLVRQFRSELELGQSVLDCIDDGIAVFSLSCHLMSANAAYYDLWGEVGEDHSKTVTVLDATKLWQEQCEATPIWGDFREFSCTTAERCEWHDQVISKTHGPLSVTFVPLLGGATMVRFVKVRNGPTHPTATSGRKMAESVLNS